MHRLLSNMLLWKKFVILSILGILLTGVPLGLYIQESRHLINNAADEAAGIVPAQTLLKLVQLAQQHRGLSAMVLNGNEAAKDKRSEKQKEVEAAMAAMEAIQKQMPERFGKRNLAKWQSDWRALTADIGQAKISAKDSFARHTALIEGLFQLHEFILDQFSLHVDPERETYYLIDIALQEVPRLTETMGRMRAQGSGILTRKSAILDERVALAALRDNAARVSGDIKSSLEKVLEARPESGKKLEALTRQALEATDKALQLAEAEIIKKEEFIVYPSAEFFGNYTAAIDAQFQLKDLALKELDTLLQARASALQTKQYALIAGIFILALLALFIGRVIVRSITAPLKEAVKMAERIAGGDLTADATTDRGDEIGQLLHALQGMKASLLEIVARVRSGTDTIATASGQIAAGNMDLSSRTEQQASSLEETASSMEEFTSTVKQNADNARQANQLALSASGVADKGGAIVSQVVSTMGSINESSRKIADIISVIDGIAFQTNILALNAAVEAARAGEQGRGFAVVAAEVRSLAQRSATAAKEIKGLIVDSVEKVDAGSKLVDQAGYTMHEIVESIQSVADILNEITTASHEQTAGIEQINIAISMMDQVTQQNAALVEEAAAAAQSMQDQAHNLSQVVSVFKFDAHSQAIALKPQRSQAAGKVALLKHDASTTDRPRLLKSA